MYRIVLDTNVFLVCIPERSRLHWIFQKLLAGDYDLCITTDILAEYAEMIETHMGPDKDFNVLENIEFPKVRACLEAGFDSEKCQFFGEARRFSKDVPGGTAKKKNEASPKMWPFLAQRLASKQALR
ncbi:MAG: hypothetical protein H6564_21025 [Lewinellaceae bacterium]|nr:hypothetical protein [Lewinellaceae bacterium]